jgi:hypothetical protein
MAMPEEGVLDKLNAVSTGKRLANMVGFGLKTARFVFLREPISGIARFELRTTGRNTQIEVIQEKIGCR